MLGKKSQLDRAGLIQVVGPRNVMECDWSHVTEKQQLLQRRGLSHMGFHCFRPFQREIVTAVMDDAKVDIIVQMPTNAGKTTLFALPALVEQCGKCAVNSDDNDCNCNVVSVVQFDNGRDVKISPYRFESEIKGENRIGHQSRRKVNKSRGSHTIILAAETLTPGSINTSKTVTTSNEYARTEGCEALGGFIGPPEKRAAFIKKAIDKLARQMRALEPLRKQTQLILLRQCVIPSLNHIMRNVNPDGCQQHYQSVKRMIATKVSQLADSPVRLGSRDLRAGYIPRRDGGFSVDRRNQLKSDPSRADSLSHRKQLAEKNIGKLLMFTESTGCRPLLDWLEDSIKFADDLKFHARLLIIGTVKTFFFQPDTKTDARDAESRLKINGEDCGQVPAGNCSRIPQFQVQKGNVTVPVCSIGAAFLDTPGENNSVVHTTGSVIRKQFISVIFL